MAGRVRLLAAEQSGYVYVFELPTETAAAAAKGAASEEQAPAVAAAARHVRGPRAVLSSMLCHSLGAPSQHWRLRPLNLVDAVEQWALGAQVARRGAEPGAPWFATAAIGPFRSPCNCAVPSPDGRYIAVTTDQQQLTVVDQSDGFAWRAVPFDIAGSKVQPGNGAEGESQAE